MGFRLGCMGKMMLGLLGLTTGVMAQVTGDSQCGSTMCVAATVNGSEVQYVLQAQGSRDIGWMGIGFGRQMPGTPMVILWPNSDGTITISQRQASGHIMPQVVSSPPRVATKQTSASSLSGSNKRLVFTIPANTDTRQSLIYAMSSTNPGSSATDARIVEHDEHGVLTLDLTKVIDTGSGGGSGSGSGSGDNSTTTPVPIPSSGSSRPWTGFEKEIIAHAVLCSVGFLILLPAGALLARWARTFTSFWFVGHWFIQFGLTMPIIVAGVALGVHAIERINGKHLDDTHTKLGIALFVLYFVQSSLGALIHFVKPAGGWSRRPLQNYAHAIIGLALIGLAFWQVRLGYREEWPRTTGRGRVPNAVNVVWIVWVALVPVLYFAGLALLKRQFKQEKEGRHRTAAAAKDGQPYN